jgi:hypothetical protein
MTVTIGIFAAGLLVAFVARRFVTSSSGLTYTLPSATRYVSFNVIAFWLSIGIAVILGLICSGRQIMMRQGRM